MTGIEKKKRFRNLSLKTEFCDYIEAFINENPQYGYRKLAQFFEDAGRELLKELKASESEEPRFRKLNSDQNGVKIWDSRLRKTADVYFKPNGIRCILDDSNTCEHVYFALTLSEVRDIVRAKRREGWKLPDL
jgi:hypothetical protein